MSDPAPVQPVEKPILCGPYEEPTEHWFHDRDSGEAKPVPGRRPASYFFKTERTGSAQRTFFAEESRRLQARIQDADAELAKASAKLAKASAELEELRNPVTGIDDTIAIVPVDSLQLARTQFDFLAAGFAKTGDVISQTICQIGACAIDKALADNVPSAKN